MWVHTANTEHPYFDHLVHKVSMESVEHTYAHNIVEIQYKSELITWKLNSQKTYSLSRKIIRAQNQKEVGLIEPAESTGWSQYTVRVRVRVHGVLGEITAPKIKNVVWLPDGSNSGPCGPFLSGWASHSSSPSQCPLHIYH